MLHNWHSTEKQPDMVLDMWVHMDTSESTQIPRSRTEVVGVM